MRVAQSACAFVLLALAVGIADAQLIVEDFDSQETGSPPAWLWWENGSSGTILVDDTVYRGASGKAVELVRTVFDGSGFGFGRSFRPIDGSADLTFFFRVALTADEVLTAIGGNNADDRVAWWVGVGGAVGSAVGTYSLPAGWNHVMDVVPDTWYGVHLEIDVSTFTYDITVWQNDIPANTTTETGIPFRNGSAATTIDQIQFGNFSDSSAGPAVSAFIDDVTFVGATVLKDGFESANTSGWSSSTRPTTQVTDCYQTVTTDAILSTDLICDSGAFESVAVELGASNITLDLNGHVISGHPLGIGVRAMDVDGISVKNGRIEDFISGLDLVRTHTATTENLAISDLLEDDPDEFRMGMRITESLDVLVRDCFFKFLPVAHKEAIVSATSEVTVDNVEVNQASVGVNVSSNGNPSGIGTDATITNNRFVGVTIAGVLVQWTDETLIAHNEFDHNEVGVSVDTHTPGGNTGLTIEENSIHDGFIGVHFMGNSDSSVLENVMRNGWRGIFVDSIMGCPEGSHQPGCFYATGNVISGNNVTGYFIDLYHHLFATGNTWTNNICLTKEGVEIPACMSPAP